MKTSVKIGIAVIVCTIGFFAIRWMRSGGETVDLVKKKEPIPVEVVVAKKGPIVRRVRSVGTLSAVHAVKLHPQTNGRVTEIFAQEGQQVEEGAKLFQIDDSLVKAKLKEAQAIYALKKEDYRRASTLLEKKFGSVQMRDKSLAELQQAEAAVEENKVRLAQTLIKAPFEGILGLHEVSVGAYVSEQNPIASLVDLDPINVAFGLPESYLSDIHVGDEVDVTVEDVDILPVGAKIIAISPEIDESTRTVQVRAQLPNKGKVYRPGEYARVMVTAGTVKDAITIPSVCIERDGDAEFVLVVDDNLARRQDISTDMRDGPNVQVTHGLKEGDVVVSVNQFRVRDGDEVKIVENPDVQQAKEVKKQ